MLSSLPNRRSATAAAEHAIREAIVSGELAPGDRLPSERVLSARLGVSRLTLRAALATLSAAGLISVRHGSGYTVRDVRETGGTDLLPGLVEGALGTLGSSSASVDTIADLLRLRRHLAAAVVEAIAEHPPSAADRRAVHRAIDRFADAVAELRLARDETSRSDPDTRGRTSASRGKAGRHAWRSAFPDAPGDRLRAAELAIVDADLGVVRALLDATGSMILRVCLNPIIAVLRDSAPLRTAIYAAPETNLVGWRALGVWIDKPAPEAIPMLLDVLAERDRNTVTRLRGPRGS